jgi:hypothetical protein
LPFDAPDDIYADQCFDSPPFPHFSDRPTCFVQHSRPAFTPGKGLRTSATALCELGSSDISVGIDAYSDVNLARREFLHDIARTDLDPTRGTGGITNFTEMGMLHVCRDDPIVEVPAHVGNTATLPFHCDALLGMPAIDALGIDLNAQKVHPEDGLQCFVGEKTLRAWWDANAGSSVDAKVFDLDEIAINPDLDPAVIARTKAIIAKHSAVFGSSSGNLPKPFDCDPVELNFKPDCAPQSIPEPRWTHAQAKVITQWEKDGLANGSLEFSKSAWASRPHVVLKAPSGKRAEDADIAECKLRVCGDYRLVNTQISKLTPNPRVAHGGMGPKKVGANKGGGGGGFFF